MQLMRVLQKGLKLQTSDGALPDGDTICGSMAAHFKVSSSGNLSFYGAAGADYPSVERIALGVMLAKLARDVESRWDDVDGCLVSEEDVARSGAHSYQDGKGETPLPDVNQAHWSVERVTIRRLADIVVAALTPELRDAFVSKAKLAWVFDRAVEAGELDESALCERVKQDLASIRKTKPYRNLVKAAAQGLANATV